MKIEDYLHLYVGCQVEVSDGEVPELKYYGKMLSFNVRYMSAEVLTNTGFTNPTLIHFKCAEDTVKPILRPFNDMTMEEAEYTSEAAFEGKPSIIVSADLIRYLISRHFDVFELIEEGLAIDSTTLKKI